MRSRQWRVACLHPLCSPLPHGDEVISLWWRLCTGSEQRYIIACCYVTLDEQLSDWGRVMKEGWKERAAMWRMGIYRREGKEMREPSEPMRVEWNLHYFDSCVRAQFSSPGIAHPHHLDDLSLICSEQRLTEGNVVFTCETAACVKMWMCSSVPQASISSSSLWVLACKHFDTMQRIHDCQRWFSVFIEEKLAYKSICFDNHVRNFQLFEISGNLS